MNVMPQHRKVSLAYIAPTRIPGIAANGFQVMKMAEALCARYPQTTLIATGEETSLPDGASLRKRYGVQNLPTLRLLPAEGRLGIHLFNLRSALLARRMQADVILTRSIGAAAIAARLGIPVVWECHGLPQGFEKRYWTMLAGARGFRRLVVISSALERLMAAQHPEVAGLDVIVAHDGVDVTRFSGLPTPTAAKIAAGRDTARPVAGYAGHLYAGRGIDIIFACAQALPHWSFLIAGGQPKDVAAARRECERRDLANVELIGFVDNAELPGRLAVADVLLMPYQRRVMVSGGRLDTAQWMSPLKMFEYMAMGRPIIASDLPVLREVLDEGCARLVVPDDASQWIEALLELGQDASQSQALADAARQRVAEYDWKNRSRRILDGIAAEAA